MTPIHLNAVEQHDRDCAAMALDHVAEDFEDLARSYSANGCLDAHAAMTLAARHARETAARLRRGESTPRLSLVES